VFASTVESSDTVLLKPTGAGAAPSDPGPSGDLAYDDANNNGQYDSAETTYTASDLEDGFNYPNVNLVIPSDVGTLRNDNNGIDITANSISSEVDFESQNQQVSLTASENINIDGTTITAPNNGVDISGGTVSAVGTTFESRNNLATISATSGQLDLTSATVNADNNGMSFSSSGDMYLDNADLNSNNAQATADLGQGGGQKTLHVNGTVINDADDTLEYEGSNVRTDGSPSSGTLSRQGGGPPQGRGP
jgi:hypothetical protein